MKSTVIVLNVLLFLAPRIEGETMEQVLPYNPLAISPKIQKMMPEIDYTRLTINSLKRGELIYWEDDLIVWREKMSLHIDVPRDDFSLHGERGAIQSFRLELFLRRMSPFSFGPYLEQNVPEGDPFWQGRQNYETSLGIVFLVRF